MAVVKEEHRYGKNSAETYADLEKAIAMMGAISKTDPGALLIEGKIKFGMGAKTKVKAQVQQEGDVSIISFESRGGDVFGNAARNNVERLIVTMGKTEDTDYDVNKADKQQWLRIGYFTLGGIGVLIISIMLMVDASLVADNLLVIGFLIAAYAGGIYWVTKKR